MLNQTDTLKDRGNILFTKIEFFLVANFSDNNETENHIDSFAKSIDTDSIKQYSDYIRVFYKESSQTNVENINKNRKVIDRYSQNHDQIYQYRWNYGKGPIIRKIRNGKVVGSKRKVELKDIEN